MEQHEANEDDKADAGYNHPAQQEAVAAFTVDNLGMR